MVRDNGITRILLALVVFMIARIAFADDVQVADVIIGAGEDRSDQLSIINTIFNTAQKMALYGVGPLWGTWMALKGFIGAGKAQPGDKWPYVLMIFCGAACWGLGPIISQLLKLYK